MHDRGMIKWAPFNSVINSKYLVSEIEKENSKIKKPILSDEQINNIEKIIKEAKINNDMVSLTIYHSGFTNKITGKIIKIDNTSQKITLDNRKDLYFCEIISAKII